MAVLKPKSFWLRPADVERRWYHVDATDQTLGKMAVRIANILTGKNSPKFTPGVDSGDFVVVTNASDLKVTGKKQDKKVYRYHTGYIGHLREIPFERMMERKPDRVIQLAVRRMLPKNKLGRKYLSRLRIYAGKEHPHGSQMPQTVKVS